MGNPLLTRIHSYYDSLESRIGYRLFLGGTRHFGYYDSEASSPWQVNRALRRMEGQLLSALPCQKGDQVLDAGCGVGHVAIYMAREGGFNIDAIDVTPHHVVKARANIQAVGLQKQISVRQGDYHDLTDFEDATFEGVYTMETFVHARDPRKVLQEFYRVLKPGGYIAMNEYDHEKPGPHNQKFIQKLTLMNDATGMPAFQSFEYDDIQKLLIDAGFENVQQQALSKNVYPMVWLFYIFAIIPYMFLRIFGIEWYFPNTSAGAIGYKYRESIRYVQLSGRKPLASSSTSNRQRKPA